MWSGGIYSRPTFPFSLVWGSHLVGLGRYVSSILLNEYTKVHLLVETRQTYFGEQFRQQFRSTVQCFLPTRTCFEFSPNALYPAQLHIWKVPPNCSRYFKLCSVEAESCEVHHYCQPVMNLILQHKFLIHTSWTALASMSTSNLRLPWRWLWLELCRGCSLISLLASLLELLADQRVFFT